MTDAELEAQVTRVCWWVLYFFVASFLGLVAGVRAPYGRYSSDEAHILGVRVRLPMAPGIWDWWLHSLCIVSVLGVWCFQADPDVSSRGTNLWCAGLFCLHYLNRGPRFALLVVNPKPIPVPVLAMTSGFCALNGWLQGASLLALYPVPLDGALLAGSLLFGLGMYGNISSDEHLVSLRRASSAYSIPRGGLFDLVSCPNFASEMLEWAGFALMCRTPAACTFALATAMNIGPRALHHHAWYKEKFPNYPPERRALIPWIL